MKQSISQEALPGIKKVIVDLCSKEERDTANAVLEFYFKHATTIADYETLGAAAITAEHKDIYLKCAERAYILSWDISNEAIYTSRINLYKAYSALNYPEKALEYIELNLKMKPDDFESKLNKAFNISLLGRKDEADDMIAALIADDPEDVKNLKFSLSGRGLREGRTAESLTTFINAFKKENGLFDTKLNMKKWTGGAYPGRTIYVNGEGGIGDEIINIRFFKNLEAMGMRPILYSTWVEYRPDLCDVFERHGIEVISDEYSIKRDQLWVDMMSLPGYLGLNESNLWAGQYLFPKKDPRNEYSQSNDVFRIGIKCNGNPYFSQDVYRCIPIEKMLEYIPTEVNGIKTQIYYFDKEKTYWDDKRVINMKHDLTCWEDTLDLLSNMDLVMTSCTSLAHAAGAMAMKSIVLTPIAEYYTWTSTRTDESTPWYSYNTKVLKQTKVRSWDEPLSRANEIIKEMMNEKASSSTTDSHQG